MAEIPDRAAITTLGVAAAAIWSSGAAGTWIILRNIHITNETAGQITVTLGISLAPATDAATGKRFFTNIPIAANSALDWSGFQVLKGGATAEVLYGLCSVANGATVTVSGVTGP